MLMRPAGRPRWGVGSLRLQPALDGGSLLRSWVDMIRDGTLPEVVWPTGDQQAEWAQFLARFDHRDIAQWRDIKCVLPVRWLNATEPKPRTRMRIERLARGRPQARLASVACESLGTTMIPDDIDFDHFTGLVRDDQKTLVASFFGH